MDSLRLTTRCARVFHGGGRDLHSEVPQKGAVRAVTLAPRRLAVQRESRIEEGHLMSDHVHIAIPPKYAVSHVIGYITSAGRVSGPFKPL